MFSTSLWHMGEHHVWMIVRRCFDAWIASDILKAGDPENLAYTHRYIHDIGGLAANDSQMRHGGKDIQTWDSI
jgi:hypothetical protein